jgi:hypothetical protein
MSLSIVRRNLCILVAIVAACPAAGNAADDRTLTAENADFFEQKIRPLLVERCYQCHSQGRPIKAGLTLDSRTGWQTGGETGPAIVPGRPDESLLVKAVRYQDADLQMPPAGKLPEAQIALLEEWVRRGAPDPRDDAALEIKATGYREAARTHWAYQPLSQVDPPPVKRGAWPLNAVDHFVLARLEGRGLQPSPDADRHTWLRRVSLDLTGLPPTPEEIHNFVNDRSDDAWAHVVDRLLASRSFGERWARPWLDLVGYADQIGSANNVPAEHAWRYRDYVIRSFNADKPFDEFVREQIAGDLLTAGSIEQRQDQLIATGFLVLGNVNIVEADKLQMEMDLVDQQIEKVGKAFLGMTLQCSRCHDHKFDPVTLADYYGLAGIFASTESTYKESRGVWSSVTKVPLPETLEEFTRRQVSLRAHDGKIALLQHERTAAETRINELQPLIKAAKESTTPSTDGARPLAELEKEAGELAAKVKGLDQQLLHLNYLKPAPPLALGVNDARQIVNGWVQVRGNPHVLGAEMPRGFVQVATHGAVPDIGQDQSGRWQLARWLTGAAQPLVSRVTVNRLWQRLFGRGIVASVDYFGLRGEPPTHPELLDYLAGQFIRDGWSQKRLIRQLVLSRTYRQRAQAALPKKGVWNPTAGGRSLTRPQSQGSRHLFWAKPAQADETTEAALAADPDNRLYWRMSPRRLDAEMLRDSVLAVSGTLEPCQGGPALAPEFSENVGGLDPKDVNPVSFSLTKFRDDQLRLRTIYLPVVRSSEQRGPADVLNFFDFSQPARFAGDRPTTAVASQALFLLNGPLLKDASQKLAAEIQSHPGLSNDDERITLLYLRALNRRATSDETQTALTFLATDDAPVAAGDTTGDTRGIPRDNSANWQRLVHALLASNEFLFRL